MPEYYQTVSAGGMTAAAVVVVVVVWEVVADAVVVVGNIGEVAVIEIVGDMVDIESIGLDDYHAQVGGAIHHD